MNEQSSEYLKSNMSCGSCDTNGGASDTNSNSGRSNSSFRHAGANGRHGHLAIHMQGGIQRRGARAWLSAAAAFVMAFAVGQSSLSVAAPAATPPADNTPLAFPGAVGWAAHTPGGRGGKIIKVTTLSPTGPGSFIEAVETKGPRIIVFEVGGVIDLNRQTVRIREPYLTIAGQTAPSPGITLIRGGMDIYGHDVVVQHIRIRVGTTGAPHFGNVDFDAISTIAAHDVIVDHCSLTWATDENLSASGPRFTGKTPDEWREGTSHRITFSNNIIAEGLAHASHIKGEHSKGSLIHDNVTDILIVGNLYSHNKERNPLFKGGVRGAVINNLIYDPGDKATHYNLIAEEWGDHEKQLGHMTLIGNVYRAGISTRPELPLFMLGGSGDMELYSSDNIMVDWIGRKVAEQGSYTNAPVGTLKAKKAMLPAGLKVLSSKEVQDSVIKNAGARPWDRQLDGNDWRIVADAIESRGYVIDSEADVGGYPVQIATFAQFDPAQWDLDTMTKKGS